MPAAVSAGIGVFVIDIAFQPEPLGLFQRPLPKIKPVVGKILRNHTRSRVNKNSTHALLLKLLHGFSNSFMSHLAIPCPEGHRTHG